jgi:hypothetical protein
VDVGLSPVASVTVTPATASLVVGQTVQLSAVPKDSAGTTLVGRTVTWTSSNASVATISGSGLVTARAAGGATVTATSEGKIGTATITVALVPVASVAISPAVASILPGGTVQLVATLRDSSGNTLNRTVAWSSDNPGVASVNSSSGLVTGNAQGKATIVATSEGKTGTADVSVADLPLSGALADPTLLPVASASQGPQLAAYDALNVRSLAAGQSYLDPRTGVRVYKLTSSTYPAAASMWGGDYAEAGDEISLPHTGDTRTVLVYDWSGAWYLIDFTPGVGVSNARRLTGAMAPASDICFTFSNNPATPYYAYVLNGSQLVRFDIRTMTLAPGNGFPLSDTGVYWLHQSKNDEFFVWMRGSLAVGYEPSTGTRKTYNGSGFMDEPRIDREGRYVAISSGSSFKVWDWQTNTISWQNTTTNAFSHNASLRRRWIWVDVNAEYPPPYRMADPSTPNSMRDFGAPAHGHEHYINGNWVQPTTGFDDQWALASTPCELEPSFMDGWLAPGGMIYMTINGERRLLGHPYNDVGLSACDTNAGYVRRSFVKQSPDGKYVRFVSNMHNRGGRSDVFLVEVPTR